MWRDDVPLIPGMFTVGQDYTRQAIHEQLGGSVQSYLPTVHGRVVCACLKKETNPEAPRVILVGKGPDIERAGAIFASQQGAVPVFLKRETNAWTFEGYFRVERSSVPGDDHAQYLAGKGTEVTRVIYLQPAFLPTADPALLELLTREALQAPSLPRPAGQAVPKQVGRESLVYERDPLVRAFVRRRAAGKCECCGRDAPFLDLRGDPFLEVHHIDPLSEQGPDTVENAAAICPNCHRECHHGRGTKELRARLKAKTRAVDVV